MRLDHPAIPEAGGLPDDRLRPRSQQRLLGLGVNSYLDKPEDVVTLAVQMGALPDGAIYAAQTTLDAKAKNIRW